MTKLYLALYAAKKKKKLEKVWTLSVKMTARSLQIKLTRKIFYYNYDFFLKKFKIKISDYLIFF